MVNFPGEGHRQLAVLQKAGQFHCFRLLIVSAIQYKKREEKMQSELGRTEKDTGQILRFARFGKLGYYSFSSACLL